MLHDMPTIFEISENSSLAKSEPPIGKRARQTPAIRRLRQLRQGKRAVRTRGPMFGLAARWLRLVRFAEAKLKVTVETNDKHRR